jgi:hypothetical protein
VKGDIIIRPAPEESTYDALDELDFQLRRIRRGAGGRRR